MREPTCDEETTTAEPAAVDRAALLSLHAALERELDEELDDE